MLDMWEICLVPLLQISARRRLMRNTIRRLLTFDWIDKNDQPCY